MIERVTIIVCGSRDGIALKDIDLGMQLALTASAANHVVVGSYRGVDRQVFEWCIRKEIDCTVMPARWKTGFVRGPAEGPIRNERMAATWQASWKATYAFPGRDGTANMIEISDVRWGRKTFRWRGGAWEELP